MSTVSSSTPSSAPDNTKKEIKLDFNNIHNEEEQDQSPNEKPSQNKKKGNNTTESNTTANVLNNNQEDSVNQGQLPQVKIKDINDPTTGQQRETCRIVKDTTERYAEILERLKQVKLEALTVAAEAEKEYNALETKLIKYQNLELEQRQIDCQPLKNIRKDPILLTNSAVFVLTDTKEKDTTSHPVNTFTKQETVEQHDQAVQQTSELKICEKDQKHGKENVQTTKTKIKYAPYFPMCNEAREFKEKMHTIWNAVKDIEEEEGDELSNSTRRVSEKMCRNAKILRKCIECPIVTSMFEEIYKIAQEEDDERRKKNVSSELDKSNKQTKAPFGPHDHLLGG